MLSVRIVVFQDGEGYVPVFVGELIFQDDFMEKAGYVGGGIAEGAASEGSEHQGVVAVYQAYTRIVLILWRMGSTRWSAIIPSVLSCGRFMPATDMNPSSRGSSISRNPLLSSSRNTVTDGV